MRNEFVITNRSKNNEFMGAITDKRFKLEVVISNVSEINFQRGSKLCVIGEVCETGKINAIFLFIFQLYIFIYIYIYLYQMKNFCTYMYKT